jgi:hypothetical protein
LLPGYPAGATFKTAAVVSQTAAAAVNWETADYAHSEWIGATATNPKAGTFAYQTSFSISGSIDLKSVDVQFDINADDNVAILVNGQNTGIYLTSLWTAHTHVDLSGASNWFHTGTNTIEFDITNTGAGPTGLKIDSAAVTALTTDVMPVTVSLAGTGAVAGDTLSFTGQADHVLTQAEINGGIIVEQETVPTGHSVSTFTATLTDAAGNTSTVATESVFGSGNLSAAGTVGADVFKWTLDSHGAAGAPAVDTISSFNTAQDVLDLRDLLIGENSSNLANYINVTTSGGNTVIHISHSGGFTGGTYAAGAEDQQITLAGVNLFSTYATIQDMINAHKLLVD